MKKQLLSIFTILFCTTFSVAFSQAPGDIVIADQSRSITECEGKTVGLFVDAYAQSHKDLNYQWYFDGKIMSGETKPVLSFASIKTEQSGNYRCRITLIDNSETVWSKVIAVYALRPTSVTTEPNDITMTTFPENGSVALNFRAHVNGIPIEDAQNQQEYFKVQWYKVDEGGDIKLKDNNIYNGTATNRLSIKIISLVDTSYYYATIEGRCGIDTTRKVKVITNISDLVWVTQPVGLNVCENTTNAIKALAKTSINLPITYQWFKDGVKINDNDHMHGSSTKELVFDNMEVGDIGDYWVEAEVAQIGKKIVSLSAHVNVKKLPSIAKQPVDIETEPGVTALLFNMIVEESDEDTYITFYHDGVELEKEFKGTGIEYEVDNLQDTVAGKYWCIVRNSCGAISTDTITVSVWDLYWVEQPINYEVCEMGEATFVAEGGTKSSKFISYQWFHEDGTPVEDNDDITGAKATHLTFNTVHKEYGGKYYCVITLEGTNKTLTSNVVTLTVKLPPKIVKQPENGTYKDGDKNIMFQMLVQEDTNPTYITFYHYDNKINNWVVVEPEFEGFGIEYEDYANDNTAGRYFCKVRNSCGITYSDTITVNVTANTILTVSTLQLDNSNIVVYPNPASDFATAKVELQKPEHVVITLFNTISRNEIEIFDGNGNQGTNYFNMDIAGASLPSGMYIVKIQTGGVIKTGKLVIVK